MCDYHSVKYGRICFECLEELRLGGRRDIAAFMGLDKPNGSEQEGWEAELNAEFKSRYEDD